MEPITNTQRMPRETHRLYVILQPHRGKARAVSMIDLFQQWSGVVVPRSREGKPLVDVATWSRHMRRLIDDLRDIYGVPVMSSSHAGYWLCGTTAELDQVCKEFRARGLKSLSTSARLRRISLTEEVKQLALSLQQRTKEVDHVDTDAPSR